MKSPTYPIAVEMNVLAPTTYNVGILVWSIDSYGLCNYFDFADTVAVALEIVHSGRNPAEVASMVAHRIIYAVPAIAGVPSKVPDDRDPVGYLSGGQFMFANGSTWELLADNDLWTWSPEDRKDGTSYEVCVMENGLPATEDVSACLEKLIIRLS